MSEKVQKLQKTCTNYLKISPVIWRWEILYINVAYLQMNE